MVLCLACNCVGTYVWLKLSVARGGFGGGSGVLGDPGLVEAGVFDGFVGAVAAVVVVVAVEGVDCAVAALDDAGVVASGGGGLVPRVAFEVAGVLPGAAVVGGD